MSRTRKDSLKAKLAAMSPNGAEDALRVQTERETLRRWREDVKTGRAHPAAGDLLTDALAWVDRTEAAAKRETVAPAWQPDLFDGAQS